MASFFLKLRDRPTLNRPNQKHQTYTEILNILHRTNEVRDDYFKFSFVRNPWDRQVGRFFHDKRVGDIPADVTFEQWIKWFEMRFNSKKGFLPAFEDPSALGAWCSSLGSIKPKFLTRWDWPCFYWCCDEGQQLNLDFIGRVENLAEDWKVVAKKLDLPLELPHKNQSNRGPYQDYYTRETRDIVETIFAKDIEHFNYTFD